MTIRIKVRIEWEYHLSHSQVMWFSCKSFNLALHFSRQLSWRHNNLPKSNCKRWTWKLTVFPSSLWPYLSQCQRLLGICFQKEQDVVQATESLSTIRWQGMNHLPLVAPWATLATMVGGLWQSTNVSVSALPRLCTARLSEHHCGLQHGSKTSAFCYWDTVLQKESQTWKSRKPGTETLMETDHHLVCSTAQTALRLWKNH